jgi:hypothetical protein
VRPTDEERAALTAEWDCAEFESNLNFTPEGDVIIPILNSSDERMGDVVRQRKPYDDSRAKSLSLYEEEYSGLAWFRPPGLGDVGNVMCLVEDPISAMRLATHGVVGISLLGTSVNPRRLREVLEFDSWKTGINLALDADAHASAVRYMKSYGNRVDLRVHRLFHDVKDMDSNELLNFLRVLGV